jgi:transcriptional regulator GlxA family with amidase domain
MKSSTCSAFLFDGFMDHQIARVMAGLNRCGDFVLETFSTKKQAITAASGLHVMPNTHLTVLDPEDIDILLLPGGDLWEKGDNLEIFPLIAALAGRRPVIAIGSAVLGLADIGLLDNIRHTGASPGYIKHYCPEYDGAAFFADEACVSARGIITIKDEEPPGFGLSTGERAEILQTLATLQEILSNNHGLLDPAGQRK